MDSTAFSPTLPPPWYQRPRSQPPTLAVSTPEETVDTARSSSATPWSIKARNIRSAYRTSPSCPAPSSSIAAPFCIQYLDSPTDREARKAQDQGTDARPCVDQRPPGDDRRAPRATTRSEERRVGKEWG